MALRLFAASDKVLVGTDFLLRAANLLRTLKADGNDFSEESLLLFSGSLELLLGS